MPIHTETVARASYEKLLAAVKLRKEVRIAIAKVRNSRMWAAAVSVSTKPIANHDWNTRNPKQLTFLRKANAVNVKGEAHPYGSTQYCIGKGDGEHIVIGPGADPYDVQKAFSRYFGAVLGRDKKTPRVMNEIDPELDVESFTPSTIEWRLSRDEADDFALRFESPEIIDPKFFAKVPEVGDPESDVSDERLNAGQRSLDESRTKKDGGRASAEDDAERARSTELGPDMRANIGSMTRRLVASATYTSSLSGEKDKADETEMVKMIASALEDLAVRLHPAERQRKVQSRILGLQLALSSINNFREISRMTPSPKAKVKGLSKADRKRLEEIVGDNEITNHHDLVTCLFEILKHLAEERRLVDLASNDKMKVEFWGAYDLGKADSSNLYRLTRSFNGADDTKKVDLIEQAIRIVKKIGAYPDKTVDMLNLVSNGPRLDWNYVLDVPPPKWWERNGLQSSAAGGVRERLRDMQGRVIEEAEAFKDQLNKDKEGKLFRRVYKALRSQTRTPGVDAREEAPLDAHVYRNPVSRVDHAVDLLRDMISQAREEEPGEGGVAWTPMWAKVESIIDKVDHSDLGTLLKDLDDPDMAGFEARLKAARTAIMGRKLAFEADLHESGLLRDYADDADCAEPLTMMTDIIENGFGEAIEVLNDVSLHRFCDEAIASLHRGYEEAGRVFADTRARYFNGRPGSEEQLYRWTILTEAMGPVFHGVYEDAVKAILSAEDGGRRRAVADAASSLRGAAGGFDEASTPIFDDVEGEEERLFQGCAGAISRAIGSAAANSIAMLDRLASSLAHDEGAS